MTTQDSIQIAIDSLPTLPEDSVPLDDTCPICLMSFASIFCETAVGTDMVFGGVTKLVGCGHLFCRKDLAEWIRGLHGNCPTCRSSFLDIHPPSESDDESSDGGEYLPNDEDEDEEDTFLDTDGFTDLDAEEEFDVDEMDLDVDLDLWNDAAEDGGERLDVVEEWGLTDGESFSDEDISLDGDGDGQGEDVVGVTGEEGDTTFVDNITQDDTK